VHPDDPNVSSSAALHDRNGIISPDPVKFYRIRPNTITSKFLQSVTPFDRGIIDHRMYQSTQNRVLHTPNTLIHETNRLQMSLEKRKSRTQTKIVDHEKV
jgi:hypothetical protein